MHVREFCPAGSGVIYDLSGEAGRVSRGLGARGVMQVARWRRRVCKVA